MRDGYPEPTSRAVTAVMKGNRKRDTRPEVRLRSLLHRAGLRFRKDYPLRPPGGRVIRVDIAFPRARVAVFVDGCFWHCCPEHGNVPTANASYWQPKLARNVVRDRAVDDALTAAGWQVVRVWEHENAAVATRRIAHRVRTRATDAHRISTRVRVR